MLTHSSLGDIEYSHLSHESNKCIKQRQCHQKRKQISKKFIHCDDKCAVCLDDATYLDTKLFPCGHSFHGQCLIQWVTLEQNGKFNCPLCRQDIEHFVQMTANQDINKQLIQIWNEHYLCTDTSDDEIITKKSSKCTQQNQETHMIEPTVSKDDVTDTKPLQCSIWKYIWSSALPLYQTSTMHSRVIMLNHNDIIMTDNALNHNTRQSQHNIYLSNWYPFEHNIKTVSMDTCVEQHQTETVQDEALNESEVDDDLQSFLKFSLLNFKSGFLAGVCAGTTTYLIAEHLLNKGVFRRSLFPILSESIPNVAIFFTSYEHLKTYLFNVDNRNKTWYHTFSERFVSAGIAASIVGVIGNRHIGYGALLPLRYAAFFGGFELCKDVLNKEHENLNLLSVASSAAIGGAVSHGLYYPLFLQRNTLMNITSFEGVMGTTKDIVCRNMYRGFVSSLSKFLPSCVVCSCAFEYGKRYLSI